MSLTGRSPHSTTTTLPRSFCFWNRRSEDNGCFLAFAGSKVSQWRSVTLEWAAKAWATSLGVGRILSKSLWVRIRVISGLFRWPQRRCISKRSTRVGKVRFFSQLCGCCCDRGGAHRLRVCSGPGTVVISPATGAKLPAKDGTTSEFWRGIGFEVWWSFEKNRDCSCQLMWMLCSSSQESPSITWNEGEEMILNDICSWWAGCARKSESGEVSWVIGDSDLPSTTRRLTGVYLWRILQKGESARERSMKHEEAPLSISCFA